MKIHSSCGDLMAEFTYDFDSVQHITTGAVGDPGQRVFYVQARQGYQLLSLIAEKEQIRALANAVERLLDELGERDPRIATSDDLLIKDMSLQAPLEPECRIVQMGLGYDAERDMVVIVIQGMAETMEGDIVLARISASRPQMRALSVQAMRIVTAGRPICGNCGRPIDPDGHFCPERNGHGPGKTAM